MLESVQTSQAEDRAAGVQPGNDSILPLDGAVVAGQ